MKHFVITRFNIGCPSKEWITDRLDMMKKWHIPSMKSQTNKNFTYCVIIDDKTDNDTRNKLDEMLVGLNYLYLIDRRKNKDRSGIFKEHGTTTDDCGWYDDLKNILRNENVVMTSRIDNDDFYIPNTVDRIQRSVNESKIPYLLEPEYCFFIGKTRLDFGVTRYNALLPSQKNQISPACTLVEYGNSAETCYCGAHNKLGNKYPFEIIRGINWGRFGNGAHEFDANWDTNKRGNPVWKFNFMNYDEFINNKDVLIMIRKRKDLIPV
jgi:hypothetical protein